MTRAHASAVLFGGAALSLTKLAALAQPAIPLRIGVILGESSAEVYYAKELGTFTKAGLVVDVQPFGSTAPALSALVAGALDITFGTIPAIALAHVKSLPFFVIAPASMTTVAQPPTELVVRSDGPIRTAKDLEGKVLVVPGLDTLNEYGARAWIDQNGGDSSKVKFVEMGFPLMPGAVAAGRVDAASVTEPFVAVATQTGNRILANPNVAIGADFLGTGYFATAAWASSHPDVVARFATVIRETAIWANSNPDKTVSMLAQFTKVDPSTIALMVRARYAERLTAALIQPVVDVAAKYNGFSKFSAADLIFTIPR